MIPAAGQVFLPQRFHAMPGNPAAPEKIFRKQHIGYIPAPCGPEQRSHRRAESTLAAAENFRSKGICKGFPQNIFPLSPAYFIFRRQ